MTDQEGLMPLYAAGLALGIKPISARGMAQEVNAKPDDTHKGYRVRADKDARRKSEKGLRGRFPVDVRYRGRYQVCSRADVQAALEARPHLTQAEYERVLAAHAAAGGHPEPTGTERGAEAILASREYVTVAEMADVLQIVPDAVHKRHKAGKLGFEMAKDGAGRYLARSLDVAAWLRTQEPQWPSVADFATVRTLDLADIAESMGEPRYSPSRKTVLDYLDARPRISVPDYALITLPAGEDFDRYLAHVKYQVTRAKTIPAETEPMGQRTRWWILAETARDAIGANV